MLRRLLTALLACSVITSTWIGFSMGPYIKQPLDNIPNYSNNLSGVNINCTDCTTIPFNNMHTPQVPQTSLDNTYMELKVKARLGNQLFAYAALRQFSGWKNSTPIVLPDFEEVSEIFKIRPSPHVNVDRAGFKEVLEMRRDLEGTLSEIQRLQPANISFVGFYQSPRFFEGIRHEIREEYVFREAISTKARGYLRSVVPDKWKSKDYIQVAIHIRRTDHISYKFIEQLGFNFPPESYFRLAMDYFTKNHSRVQFVVASDDLVWCRTFFDSFTENIVFSENHTAAEDLAIMSYCNHSIITIGTFSWWVGWLCSGHTIYYANYNRRPSWVSMVLHPSHYIPHDEYNNWIPFRHKKDRSMFRRPLLTHTEWDNVTDMF